MPCENCTLKSSRFVENISLVTAPLATFKSSRKISICSWYCSCQNWIVFLPEFAMTYIWKIIWKFHFSFTRWLAENYHMVQFTPFRRFQYTTKYKSTWYSANSKVSLSVSWHLVILITPLQDGSELLFVPSVSSLLEYAKLFGTVYGKNTSQYQHNVTGAG